jgi:hypothetical protein
MNINFNEFVKGIKEILVSSGVSGSIFVEVDYKYFPYMSHTSKEVLEYSVSFFRDSHISQCQRLSSSDPYILKEKVLLYVKENLSKNEDVDVVIETLTIQENIE